MVQLASILEVGPVNGKLIKRVQHPLQSEVGCPWIRPGAGEDEHPVVDSRAVDRAHGVLHRRRVVAVRRSSEDDVPRTVQLMYLGSPDVGRPRLTAVGVWVEDDACLDIIPVVRESLGALESDVVVGGVGEQVPVLAFVRVPGHPWVSDILGEDWVSICLVRCLVRADLGGIPALGARFVGIKRLASYRVGTCPYECREDESKARHYDYLAGINVGVRGVSSGLCYEEETSTRSTQIKPCLHRDTMVFKSNGPYICHDVMNIECWLLRPRDSPAVSIAGAGLDMVHCQNAPSQRMAESTLREEKELVATRCRSSGMSATFHHPASQRPWKLPLEVTSTPHVNGEGACHSRQFERISNGIPLCDTSI